jgi:pimeloyl-ACP methyl ester carboxylesterase
MTPDAPELLFDGHERAFFTGWFPRLAADPIAYTSETLDVVTHAYTGRDSLRCGFEHYRTLLEDGRTNRAWGDAGGRLTMPVLAIGGEFGVGDRLANAARDIAPHVRTAVIPGSGHFVPEERPDALVRELMTFYSEAPSRTQRWSTRLVR